MVANTFKYFVHALFLIGGASSVTWSFSDEDLWYSMEAQDFYNEHFKDCPYSEEENSRTWDRLQEIYKDPGKVYQMQLMQK